MGHTHPAHQGLHPDQHWQTLKAAPRGLNRADVTPSRCTLILSTAAEGKRVVGYRIPSGPLEASGQLRGLDLWAGLAMSPCPPLHSRASQQRLIFTTRRTRDGYAVLDRWRTKTR